MASEKVKSSLSGGTKFHNKSEQYREETLAGMLKASRVTQKGQTNAEYARTNEKFRKACETVGIEPTARQASKYRNGIGKAFKGA